MKRFASLFAMMIVSAAMTLGAYKLFFEKPVHITHVDRTPPPARYTSGGATTGIADFSFAAEKSVNAVVHVLSTVPGQTYYDPFQDFFWGGGRRQYQAPPSQSSGSGVIISADGYIVTNYHVIENAQEIKITLNDNREYTATLIGTDPATDIALLKIKEEDLPFLQFHNSDEVKIGEWVLAVGNPFNLNSTVTAGIVSAKSRSISIINDRFAIESFIQTDAAVNPGNSGGALVNTEGALIGINTAISTHTGSFEGYSFAVPSNIVYKVIADIKEFGSVQRAFLGVNIRDLDATLASELKTKVKQGVYIGGLTDNGAAQAGGLKVGDIIVKINEKAINKSSELQEIISRFRPGDQVTVSVNRDGEMEDFVITLRNKNGSTKLYGTSNSVITGVLGVELEALTADELREEKLKHGVKVTRLMNGKFRSEGIQEGFIITEVTVDNITTKVLTPEDLNSALKDKKNVGVYLKGKYPKGNARYYAFGI